MHTDAQIFRDLPAAAGALLAGIVSGDDHHPIAGALSLTDARQNPPEFQEFLPNAGR
jgi:hypothetical protein